MCRLETASLLAALSCLDPTTGVRVWSGGYHNVGSEVQGSPLLRPAEPAEPPRVRAQGTGSAQTRGPDLEDLESRQEEDRYRLMLSRSDSENIASNYFRPKRASQILGTDPMKSLGEHPACLLPSSPSLSALESHRPGQEPLSLSEPVSSALK